MAHEKRDRFIKNPIFEGGKEGMNTFIQTHLRYPQEALDGKIEGTVYTHIDIDHKGNVTQVNVLKGIGHGCEEEAIRVIKLMKFQTNPPKGQRVVWHQKFNINFRLPTPAVALVEAPVSVIEEVSPAQLNISYDYVVEPPKTEENNSNQNNTGGGYSYTISW
jgi:TonB family protein